MKSENASKIASDINAALCSAKNMTNADIKVVIDTLEQVCSVFISRNKTESQSIAKVYVKLSILSFKLMQMFYND